MYTVTHWNVEFQKMYLVLNQQVKSNEVHYGQLLLVKVCAIIGVLWHKNLMKSVLGKKKSLGKECHNDSLAFVTFVTIGNRNIWTIAVRL